MNQVNANALMIPLADESVQTVVTSPPYYGLRNYGVAGQLGLEETPAEFIFNMVMVFREVWRVLKPDGTLWVNMGDSYSGSGKGQSENGVNDSKNNKTRGMKVDVISASDIGLKPKNLIGMPWRLAFALQDDGWILRQDIIWAKPAPMPESVTDRCTKAHEYIFLLSKQPRYYYDQEAIVEPSRGVTGGGFSRSYAENQPKHGAMELDRPVDNGTRNKRSVWTVPAKGYAGAHFATFPPDLIRPCILAGAPEGGVVLDPFSGSGTTVQVAREHGRIGVGLELNRKYIELARERNQQRTIWEGE